MLSLQLTRPFLWSKCSNFLPVLPSMLLKEHMILSLQYCEFGSWELAHLNGILTPSVITIIIIITVLWCMDMRAQHRCGAQRAAFRSLLLPPTLGHMPKVFLHDKPSTRPKHWNFDLVSLCWFESQRPDSIAPSSSPCQPFNQCPLVALYASDPVGAAVVLEVNQTLQVRLTLAMLQVISSTYVTREKCPLGLIFRSNFWQKETMLNLAQRFQTIEHVGTLNTNLMSSNKIVAWLNSNQRFNVIEKEIGTLNLGVDPQSLSAPC